MKKYKKLVDKFFLIKYTLNIKIFINQNFDTSNYLNEKQKGEQNNVRKDSVNRSRAVKL